MIEKQCNAMDESLMCCDLIIGTATAPSPD